MALGVDPRNAAHRGAGGCGLGRKGGPSEAEKELIDAEDLSAGDDLLSWILVDQMGCLPDTRLGVHPQQVKFEGPKFQTSDVLKILQETVIKDHRLLDDAKHALLRFPLIQSHHATRDTEKQQKRFEKHLERYLLTFAPTSRVEFWITKRYTEVTGHVELAAYATKPLAIGTTLKELQGTLVKLPEKWIEENEAAERYAAASEDEDGDDSGSDQDQGDDGDDADASATTPSARREKRERRARQGRRSDRIKRRDFSVVKSSRNGDQLLLGPARFLNHDCNPNVVFQGESRSVTFKVERPIKIGDELLTYYGDDYFGLANIECMCLSCELNGKGAFTPNATSMASQEVSRSRSHSLSSSVRAGSPSSSRRTAGPSALRNALSRLDVNNDADDEPEAGPSRSQPTTPRKTGSMEEVNGMLDIGSPGSDSVQSEPDSPDDDPPQRQKSQRRAALNPQRPYRLKAPRHKVQLVPDMGQPTAEEDRGLDRCTTCVAAMHERIWFNNRYFDHCGRCVRHALIYELPWPFRSRASVLEYPPLHLTPSDYIPKRISSVALPSLHKNRNKYVEPLPVSPERETRIETRARKFREACARDDEVFEQLREASWTAELAAEAAVQAEAQRKIDEQEQREKEMRRKEEEKAKKQAEKAKQPKGTGVWGRNWAYLTPEEEEARRRAREEPASGSRFRRRVTMAESSSSSRSSRRPRTTSALVTEDDEDELDHGDDGQLGHDTRRPNGIEGRGRGSPSPAEQHGGDSLEEVKPEPLSSPVVPRRRNQAPIIDLDDSESDESDDVQMYDSDTGQYIRSRRSRTRRSRTSSDVEIDPPPKPKKRRTEDLATGTDASTSERQVAAFHHASSASPVKSDSEPTRRGRGRPRGSGKHQRAAAARAMSSAQEQSQTPEAGPSTSTTLPTVDPRHILHRVEEQIEEIDRPGEYDWFIEGLDDEGRQCFKSLGASGPTLFPPAETVQAFVDQEHGEFLRLLKPVEGSRPPSSLPGDHRLVNRAEIKRWNPSRLPGHQQARSTPDNGTAHVQTFEQVSRMGNGFEHVALLVDTYSSHTLWPPSQLIGPWINGEYRMVVARPIAYREHSREQFAKGQILYSDDATVEQKRDGFKPNGSAQKPNGYGGNGPALNGSSNPSKSNGHHDDKESREDDSNILPGVEFTDEFFIFRPGNDDENVDVQADVPAAKHGKILDKGKGIAKAAEPEPNVSDAEDNQQHPSEKSVRRKGKRKTYKTPAMIPSSTDDLSQPEPAASESNAEDGRQPLSTKRVKQKGKRRAYKTPAMLPSDTDDESDPDSDAAAEDHQTSKSTKRSSRKGKRQAYKTPAMLPTNTDDDTSDSASDKSVEHDEDVSMDAPPSPPMLRSSRRKSVDSSVADVAASPAASPSVAPASTTGSTTKSPRGQNAVPSAASASTVKPATKARDASPASSAEAPRKEVKRAPAPAPAPTSAPKTVELKAQHTKTAGSILQRIFGRSRKPAPAPAAPKADSVPSMPALGQTPSSSFPKSKAARHADHSIYGVRKPQPASQPNATSGSLSPAVRDGASAANGSQSPRPIPKGTPVSGASAAPTQTTTGRSTVPLAYVNSHTSHHPSTADKFSASFQISRLASQASANASRPPASTQHTSDTVPVPQPAEPAQPAPVATDPRLALKAKVAKVQSNDSATNGSLPDSAAAKPALPAAPPADHGPGRPEPAANGTPETSASPVTVVKDLAEAPPKKATDTAVDNAYLQSVPVWSRPLSDVRSSRASDLFAEHIAKLKAVQQQASTSGPAATTAQLSSTTQNGETSRLDASSTSTGQKLPSQGSPVQRERGVAASGLLEKVADERSSSLDQRARDAPPAPHVNGTSSRPADEREARPSQPDRQPFVAPTAPHADLLRARPNALHQTQHDLQPPRSERGVYISPDATPNNAPLPARPASSHEVGHNERPSRPDISASRQSRPNRARYSDAAVTSQPRQADRSPVRDARDRPLSVADRHFAPRDRHSLDARSPPRHAGQMRAASPPARRPLPPNRPEYTQRPSSPPRRVPTSGLNRAPMPSSGGRMDDRERREPEARSARDLPPRPARRTPSPQPREASAASQHTPLSRHLAMRDQGGPPRPIAPRPSNHESRPRSSLPPLRVTPAQMQASRDNAARDGPPRPVPSVDHTRSGPSFLAARSDDRSRGGTNSATSQPASSKYPTAEDIRRARQPIISSAAALASRSTPAASSGLSPVKSRLEADTEDHLRVQAKAQASRSRPRATATMPPLPTGAGHISSGAGNTTPRPTGAGSETMSARSRTPSNGHAAPLVPNGKPRPAALGLKDARVDSFAPSKSGSTASTNSPVTPTMPMSLAASSIVAQIAAAGPASASSSTQSRLVNQALQSSTSSPTTRAATAAANGHAAVNGTDTCPTSSVSRGGKIVDSYKPGLSSSASALQMNNGKRKADELDSTMESRKRPASVYGS